MESKIPRGQCHECAPKEWRRTPVVTGSYELDAGIARSKNKDLPARVRFYVENVDNAYGPLTAYNGYHGYGGDS